MNEVKEMDRADDENRHAGRGIACCLSSATRTDLWIQCSRETGVESQSRRLPLLLNPNQ
jgi:hypothetical protein